MNRFRKCRFACGVIGLVSLLFTQFAVASYQCLVAESAQIVKSINNSADNPQSMPGCDGLDLEQPTLCQAQSLAGSQSFDRPPGPDVSPCLVGGFQITPALVESPAIRPVLRWNDGLMRRATAPPVAVRNCCFRI